MYLFLKKITNWLLGGNLDRLTDAIAGGASGGGE